MLNQYIKDQWLDYPVSKVDIGDGYTFARWMKENCNDDYEEIIHKESEEAGFAFLDALVDGKSLHSPVQEYTKYIGVLFRDLLKDKIKDVGSQVEAEDAVNIADNELELYLFNKAEAEAINAENAS